MKKNIWRIMLAFIVVISAIEISFTPRAEDQDPLEDNIPVYRAIFISPWNDEIFDFWEGFDLFEKALISNGWSEDNIVKLYGEDITVDDIENAIKALAENDTEYDTSLIVIGAHGSQSGFFTCNYSGHMYWTDLNESLWNMSSAGIGLIINTCHSGYALENESKLKVDGRVIITGGGLGGDYPYYIKKIAKGFDEFADYSYNGDKNGVVPMKEAYDYVIYNKWGEDDSMFWSGYPIITQDQYYPLHITFQNFEEGRIDQITNRTWKPLYLEIIRKDDESGIDWQVAQEFKPDMENISKVSIFLAVASNNPSSPIRVSIQGVGPEGEPDGNDSVFKEVLRSEIPDCPNQTYVTFDFPDNYTVEPEKTYFIVCRTTESDQGHYSVYCEKDCYPITPGSEYSCWDYEDGNWTEKDEKDVEFVSYGINTNMPPHTPKRPGGGPDEGYAWVSYDYNVTTTDIDGDKVAYGLDGDGDDVVDKWDNNSGDYYDSGDIVKVNYTWKTSGQKFLKVRAKDLQGNMSGWSDVWFVNISPNKRPNAPKITGETRQNTTKSYPYDFNLTDLDGDNMSLYIDWGDGTVKEWFGPHTNGSKQRENHYYSEKGTYTIKAKAKDIYGAESEWGYLEVTRFKNVFGYTISNTLVRNIKNKITGSNFTISASGTADSITAYLQTNLGTPPKTKCLIYRNNDSTLIGTTEEKTPVTGDDGAWVTFNFSDPKPTLVRDTEYILACWSNGTCNLSYVNATVDYGRFKNKTYDDATLNSTISWTSTEPRIYSIFCRYTTIPEITNVCAAPNTVGFGFNVTINTDIDDNGCGIDNATVNIEYPDNTTGNFTLDHIGNGTYEYVFSDTWLVGQYNYTIWAVDKSGSTNSSSGHSFNVSAEATISVCTIKDSYGNNETVNLTDPPCYDPPLIGYELLDDGDVLHMWNEYNSYYFNTSSGIQLTNHYDKYWLHNVLMLGYYSNDEWNLIYRTDELSGFNKNMDTDNETYVNATLWKDLTYSGYDFRLAVRYHLGENDSDLTVIPYIKNLGQAIPYTLAFGWEIKDIKIADTYENDTIRLYNGTDWISYPLNQTLDNKYTEMDYNTTFYLEGRNEGKYFRRTLYLRWNHTLDYLVRVKSRTGQYNAPVTLFIKVGTLAQNQEKFTMMHWLDSDDWLGVGSSELATACEEKPGLGLALDGIDLWSASTNHIHEFILDLGKNYSIKKFRGRSDYICDPTDVDIYISTDNSTWGTAVASDISTWQDTSTWVEVDSTDKQGQYIKVVIQATESGADHRLLWGLIPPGTIFDAYGDVVPTPPEISDPYPADGSTGISLTPTLNITVSDAGGDTMNITWSSNSSGSWQVFGTNNSVGNGTYHQTFSNASVNGQWWYWKVNVTDGTNYTVSSVYKFYTGYQSKIKNTGSTSIKGYLLMQVQYYNTSTSTWVVADDTVNETSPRTINWDDPFGPGGQGILALDTVFNGLANTSNLSSYGNGTYRIYAAFRDPDGNILVTDDEIELEATYEFMITFE